MLAIGRALMTNPRLLILDEATEGLAPVIRQEIWTAIRDVKGRGQAILIVDKNLKDLLPLADACVILEKGVSEWIGREEDMEGDAALQDGFLGFVSSVNTADLHSHGQGEAKTQNVNRKRGG